MLNEKSLLSPNFLPTKLCLSSKKLCNCPNHFFNKKYCFTEKCTLFPTNSSLHPKKCNLKNCFPKNIVHPPKPPKTRLSLNNSIAVLRLF